MDSIKADNRVEHETTIAIAGHTTHLGSHQLRDVDTKEVILIPAPSNDPNDPLNWSYPFRYYLAAIACMGIFMNSFMAAGPAIALIEQTITFTGPPGRYFSQNIVKVAYFITTSPLMQGVFELFWMPFIVKYGRRPVYVFSFALFTATSIWCSVANSYGNELAGRIILGIASGAGECLAPLIIADIFFLHQRGTVAGFYTASVSGGAAAGLVIGGLITISHSWRYIYHVGTALCGALTLAYFFTMPETLYKRNIAPSTPPRSPIMESQLKEAMSDRNAHLEVADIGSTITPEKISYLQSLRLYSGRYTEEPFLKLIVRPIGLLVLPPVLWAALVEAVTIGFFVAITSNAAIAFGEVYHFKTYQTGLCFISPVIGALVGIGAGGFLSDKVADMFTRRNGGIREPEMRIPAVAVSAVLAPLGLLLYGVGIDNRLHWICPTFGIGFVMFSIVQATNITIVYTIDSYRPVGGEVIVSQFAFKSAFGFLLSFYTNTWIEKSGYTKAFGAMAGITAAVMVMAVPLYFYGKRIRLASLKWRPMRLVHWNVDREIGE